MSSDDLAKLAFKPSGGKLAIGYIGTKSIGLFERNGRTKRMLVCLKATPENVESLERLLAHFQSQNKEKEEVAK